MTLEPPVELPSSFVREQHMRCSLSVVGVFVPVTAKRVSECSKQNVPHTARKATVILWKTYHCVGSGVVVMAGCRLCSSDFGVVSRRFVVAEDGLLVRRVVYEVERK